MAINLESHGLSVGAAFGAPVTVQDGQGDGHGGQQPAQDTGYSPASAFERTPGASVAHAAVEDQSAAGGGDLLSKLSGFIKAVGDVVVQLGEYIRSASGALNDGLSGQDQAAPQAPAAPAQTAAPAPQPQATALGAPAPAGPGPQPVLAGPQLGTAPLLAAQPRQTSPSLNAPSAAPTSKADSAKAALSALSAAGASIPTATVAARGGARSSQSSGFPVLNPLPPYLGDALAFSDLAAAEPVNAAPEQAAGDFQGFEANIGTGFEGFQGFEANVGSGEPQLAQAQEPALAQPQGGAAGLDQLASFQATLNGQALGAVNASSNVGALGNVIPFPSFTGPQAPATGGAFGGEASNEVTGAAPQPEAEPSSPRYAAVVFRPAFYGNLRC